MESNLLLNWIEFQNFEKSSNLKGLINSKTYLKIALKVPSNRRKQKTEVLNDKFF